MMTETFLLESLRRTSAIRELLADPTMEWILSAQDPSRLLHKLLAMSLLFNLQNTPSPAYFTRTVTSQYDEIHSLGL